MILKSAALAGSILFCGCGQKPESVLRVGTVIWPGYEPLFVGRDEGYFAETIQIVEYPGTPEIHRSFQNRAIEIATVTLDEALQLAEMQPDVRVIMAIDFSNGADALLCTPGITSLSDLKGKRIGAELNAVGAFILSRVLDLADLTLNDVEVVPLSTAGTEAAYFNREVDAVVAYEPFVSRLQEAGAHTLFDSSQMPGEIVDVLVAREETLQTHRRALTNLLTGWFRAANQFRAKNPDALQIAAHRENVDYETFLKSLGNLEILTLERNLALFDPSNGAMANTVRKLGASMKKYKLLGKMIDPHVLLDASILKQVGQ
ncbi:MAG: ABC transporter substrate-binding protein [Limisphaerales bacterium]